MKPSRARTDRFGNPRQPPSGYCADGERCDGRRRYRAHGPHARRPIPDGAKLEAIELALVCVAIREFAAGEVSLIPYEPD